MIKLNIGGQKFCTTKDTLLNSQSSFFIGLLHGNCGNAIDEKGYYFIDRDGELFTPILSFMRTGELVVPETISMERLLKEIDFYGMDSLLLLLDQRKNIDIPPVGGIYFITKLQPKSLAFGSGCKIKQVLVKANLLIIYYTNSNIDIWIYKGISFHWIKMITLLSPLDDDIDGIICNITKNNFNETNKMILSVYSKDTVVCWKITLDYLYIKASDVNENMIKLNHNIDFIHYLVNSFFLACISKGGTITIVDLSNFNEYKTVNTPFNQTISQIGETIDYSLFLGTNTGRVYEVKQNPKIGWGWSFEQIYKLNDPEFFLNTFGFSNKSFVHKVVGGNNNNSNNSDDQGNIDQSAGSALSSNNSNGYNSNNSSSSQSTLSSQFDALLNSNNFLMNNGDQDYITFITGCLIQISSSSAKLFKAFGTQDGHIHLAHKSPRGNDKYLFAAKYCVGINDTVDKIVLSGGIEGVFITGQTKSGVVKTWQYVLKNKLRGPATQCVLARSNHCIPNSSNSKSIYYADILRFKNYNDMHFISKDKEPSHSSSSSSSHHQSSSSSSLSSPGPNPLASSTGFSSTSNHSHHLSYFPNANELKDMLNNNNKIINSNGNNNNQKDQLLTDNSILTNHPKSSPYNQVSVMVDSSNTLLFFPNSNRIYINDGDINTITKSNIPIARINLIDQTPVKSVVCVTFGGCEPNITDQSYQILTIHESNEIYSWDLKDINNYFHHI